MVDNPNPLSTICLQRLAALFNDDQALWKKHIEQRIDQHEQHRSTSSDQRKRKHHPPEEEAMLQSLDPITNEVWLHGRASRLHIRRPCFDTYFERPSISIYSTVLGWPVSTEFFPIRTSRSIPRRQQSIERFHLGCVLVQRHLSQTTGAKCQICEPTAMPRAPRTSSSD